MKKLVKYFPVLLLTMMIFSCNEEKFLEEKALEFYVPSNSLETRADYQAAVNYLYNRLRWFYFIGDNDTHTQFWYATDFCFNGTDFFTPAKKNDYKNVMIPEDQYARQMYQFPYQHMITHANVIITNAPNSKSLTDTEKRYFVGEAKFFRAWAYRLLGNLFGGVPLITEQVTAPKRDYVRATREEVYTLCKDDLLDAIAVLNDVDKVTDGKLNKQVCQHLLAETYISLGMYPEAISTASAVINYTGLELMTERFGRRKDLPGDVYSDLFVQNNTHRSTGNKEGLFAIQAEWNRTTSGSPNRNGLCWFIVPMLENLTIDDETDTGIPVRTYNLLYRASGSNGWNTKLSGRGVGWLRPTTYFIYALWKDDPNDMRNSEYNIVRDFQISGVPTTHPAYGKWYVADGYKAKAVATPSRREDTLRFFFPLIRKVTVNDVDFPSTVFASPEATNPLDGGTLLQNSSSDVHKPWYVHRLAETYLLRAEAYLKRDGSGDRQNAADDINQLRKRAKTFEITASDVDIDFILDERLRELYTEELRMLTLCRMGLHYDRTKRYNDISGKSIEPYHNLWPIPFQEIERNTGAVLEQNPGYK